MKTPATQPLDAPFGPIVRFVRRVSIGDGVTSGGALGCDVVSPRLEGWMQSVGIDTTGLSRLIDAATQWATADAEGFRRRANELSKLEAERERAARFRELVPLFALIAEGYQQDGKRVSKRLLFIEAADFLRDCAGDLPGEIVADRIMASGAFSTAPRWQTIRDICEGRALSEIIGDGVTGV